MTTTDSPPVAGRAATTQRAAASPGRPGPTDQPAGP